MPFDLKRGLQIAQLVLSLLLILVILLQSKGAGLAGIFGGEGNVYRTKRGAEKMLFIATIILAIAFVSMALISLVTE